MVNTQQLANYITLNNLSGSDAATILAALPGPTLTPKPGPMTYTGLAASLGLAGASAFKVGLDTAKANDPSGQLAFIATLLMGPGFDPANTEVQAGVQIIVAAKLLTQDQANSILYITSYPFGDLPLLLDVQNALSLVAVIQLQTKWNAIFNAGMALIQTAANAGQPLPTLAEVQATPLPANWNGR